jgi:hypothetical protein
VKAIILGFNKEIIATKKSTKEKISNLEVIVKRRIGIITA